jgi:mono/diheme cytochrome c family protein
MQLRTLVVGSRALLVVGSVAVASGVLGSLRAQEVGQRTTAVVLNAYDGRQQFTTYCASCHGANAQGDGPVGLSLIRRPPDLTTFALRNGGTFDPEVVYQIIDGRKPAKGHGGANMPVWGDAFSKSLEGSSPAAVKDRIDAMVRWLQSIQRTPD